MIPALRTHYNTLFSTEKYQAFLQQIAHDFPGQLDFRVAESPVFVPADLTAQLLQAGEDIIDTLVHPRFLQQTERAIPVNSSTPAENTHTHFLILDYAICQNPDGRLTPQLIELQGFPSLFGYQAYLNGLYPTFFPVPETLRPYFGHLNEAGYLQAMRDLLLQGETPDHTVLLELFPHRQKTRIDFEATRRYWGIEPVCLTEVRRAGRSLYYQRNGRNIDIHRIYNRVIFDELDTIPGLRTDFHFSEEIDATWIGHPNWFFRISKFSLPLLKSDFVPESYFLHELSEYPDHLDDFVLKPLFSFAGQGVRLHVSAADLDAIPDKENYLLQRRVQYAPVLESPQGGVKVELRMMYIWPDGKERPQPITSLARLSRGEMIGVRYNSAYDWVGSSAAFFEQP